MSKTPEQMAIEYADLWRDMCINGARKGFLAGYHTGYNIAYELGFEEGLKTQRTLTSIQAEIKKNNENT